jgi:HAD superfamily hydrolase (TIGR01549 family)
VNTVLFDLDGTLLPMDQDVFVQAYVKELGLKAPALGFEAQRLVEVVLKGAAVMAANDGTITNEERFWQLFLGVFGGTPEDYILQFELFYQTEFARVAEAVQPTPLAHQAVQLLKEKGYQVVLATNPIFPRVATLERMRWAGLNPADFSLITTYENSRYAKPNLGYYQEILDKLQLKPEDCLMVGNDVQEDLVAARLGIPVFLVTDDLINVSGEDYSHFPHGDRQGLLEYLRKLPALA